MNIRRAKTRLYIDSPLTNGGCIALSSDHARYLGSVLRLGAGDPVVVFNARDGEWRARLGALKKGRGELVVEEQVRPAEAEPGPWLVFAPLKKTPMDFVAEKATELGVERLIPAMTDHTAVTRLNTDRMHANAREAAEQCGRLTVPDVADLLPLQSVLAAWPEERVLFVMDETGHGAPIADIVAELPAQTSIGLLVGPEGGFSASELDALCKLSFVRRAGLGPRILRAETAAVAALSCIQAWAGDWRKSPPVRTSR